MLAQVPPTRQITEGGGEYLFYKIILFLAVLSDLAIDRHMRKKAETEHVGFLPDQAGRGGGGGGGRSVRICCVP